MEKSPSLPCAEASEPANATISSSLTRASLFSQNSPPPFAFLAASLSAVRAENVPQVFDQLALGDAPIERFPGDGEAHISQVHQVAAAVPRASDHPSRLPASHHLSRVRAYPFSGNGSLTQPGRSPSVLGRARRQLWPFSPRSRYSSKALSTR